MYSIPGQKATSITMSISGKTMTEAVPMPCILPCPVMRDWGETSADQTIALAEYFLEQYNIEVDKVYANGYSGGGLFAYDAVIMGWLFSR